MPRSSSSRFAVRLKGESKLFRTLNRFRLPRSRWFFALCVIAPALIASASVAAAPPASERRTRQLQRVLDRVKQRLGLNDAVSVELVAKNPHLISVEAPSRKGGPFLVRVEQQMVDLLSTDELEAALAHELGHVWVFTHHPFLQTEQLANDVAMRVVSRDTLVRVYDKVWKSGAAKGDLASFLGPDPMVASGGGAGKQQ